VSKLLDDVVRELARLPGVGRRTALRLSMHILRSGEDDVARMIRAIGDFRTGIRYCARCNNLSDNEFCEICSDTSRDRSSICVVEQVGDVLSIEKTGQFRGLYHVLGGVISPMAGIAPSDLKIDLLLDNISRGGVREVILAISTTVEGETTLFYILNRLRAYTELKITTIARGIGFGDEIEYADELTISHAIANRREVSREP
jgi:recombination protein RecR